MKNYLEFVRLAIAGYIVSIGYENEEYFSIFDLIDDENDKIRAAELWMRQIMNGGELRDRMSENGKFEIYLY